MLISPTEPQKLRALGTTSSRPEKVGADFLISGGSRQVAIQRKKFPEDLLSSLGDGRLYTQVAMMTSQVDYAMLIVEGYGKWTTEGELISPVRDFKRFDLNSLLGIFYSLMFEFGIFVMWVRDMNATAAALEELERWLRKKKHTSLKRRPGPPKSSWGTRGNTAFGVHILQGFPGMGSELAERMIEQFGMVPLTWTHSVEELMSVPGIGKKKAEALVKALDEIGEG